MSFLSGKQAFLQILKDEGVDTMFGNPGTTESPIIESLQDYPQIRYVLALHEAVTNYRAARARPQRQGGDRANESLDVQPVESEPPERNG